MSLPRLFARRYLFSSESRSVVNLISGLSVVAVAMPVAAMIILLSVFNGFEGMIHSMYSAFDAELTVLPKEGATCSKSELEACRWEDVAEVASRSYALEQSVLLEHDGRQSTAVLRGVDDYYCEVFPVMDSLTRGDSAVRYGDWEQMVMGQTMAWQLGIRTLADAEVAAYSVKRNSFSSLLPLENYTRRRINVGGVFTVDYETERTYVLTSLRFASDLLGYEDRVSSVMLRLREGADLEKTQQKVQGVVGERFDVKTRHEMRQSFYQIMTYEKWGIFFISLLVLIIASFSVVGALSMLIVDKRRDIETLRALGADWQLVRGVFSKEGELICAVGAMLGVVIGVGACAIQQTWGIIEIPAETFLTKSYPVDFRVEDLLVVLGAFGCVAYVLSHITVRNMIKKDL